MKTKIFLICICMVLLLTACSSVKSTLGINTQEDETKKYNAYVELSDDEWLFGVARVYFDTFGTDEELTVKENFSGFTLDKNLPDKKTIYELHKGRLTKLPRQYQAAKPSFGEIDDKMLVLCDKVDAFVELYFKNVNTYYTNKEYEKDNFAQGRELHKKMILGYTELANADEDFNIAFYPKVLESEGAELPKYKEQGFDIHYYALSILLTGKEISNMFEVLERNGKDFLEADLPQYEQLYNKFNSNLEELKKLYQDSAQQKKEGYSATKAKALAQLVETAGRMQVSATDALNMIKAKTTKIKNENTGKMTSGRTNPIDGFNQRLDHLIQDYNKSIN